MRILITGGAGFIGSSLARALSEDNDVVVLDNLSPQVHGSVSEDDIAKQFSSQGIEFVKGDVRDKTILTSTMQGVDVVVHMAAETGVGQSMYEASRYFDVNVLGTATLLDVLVNSGRPLKKLVLASSRAVYGEGAYRCSDHAIVFPEKRVKEALKGGNFDPVCPVCGAEVESVPTSEDASLRPVSIYGATKSAQEAIFLAGAEAVHAPVVVLRYQNVYGPGQSLHNPYTGILAIFSGLLRNSESVNVFEDGEESRDFVFIDDVVSATVDAINHNVDSSDVFNIGSGVSTSVKDIASMLKDALKSSSPITISGDFRIGDIRHNVADITKAQSVLGFTPSVDIKSGINLFTDWVSKTESGNLGSGYRKSLEELRKHNLFS